jgi:alpha-amylase
MNKPFRFIPAFFALSIIMIHHSDCFATPTGSKDIILQSFHWNSKNNGQFGEWYTLIKGKASDLNEAGVTMVWFPPPSKTCRYDLGDHNDPNSSNGYVPMDYYDVGEYRQWVQDGWPNYSKRWYQHPGAETLYGSKSELKNAISALHSKNIKTVADIVLNHRGPRQVNVCGEWISWFDEQGKVESGKMIWGKANDCNPSEIISNDGGGGGSDDGGSDFTPNIAHSNANVRVQIIDWLKWLKNDIGFDGWRYDYVKGLSPDRIQEYNNSTNPSISIGEFWDYDAQAIIGWIDRTNIINSKRSAAFDFPTKKILTDNFGTQNYGVLSHLPGLIGIWPENAVTFLDNHDTYPPHENPYQFPDNRLLEGYAYVLTHPGIPCIFWSHYYDKGSTIHDKIKELAKIRKDFGINSTSAVNILRAENSLYAAEIDCKLIVKIGTKIWYPSDAQLTGYTLKTEYGDYKIWTRTNPPTYVRTVIFVKAITIPGQDMFIRGGIDHTYAQTALNKTCTSGNYNCAIPIQHLNLKNNTTRAWKTGDNFLDWYGRESGQGMGSEGTAFDWTTNAWPPEWGPKKTVAVDGFGEEPLNHYGPHYWMLDVKVDTSRTVNINGVRWFEFKAFVSNGSGWESDITQPAAPYTSKNHFAKCGCVNVYEFGKNNPVEIVPLP